MEVVGLSIITSLNVVINDNQKAGIGADPLLGVGGLPTSALGLMVQRLGGSEGNIFAGLVRGLGESVVRVRCKSLFFCQITVKC